MKKNEALVLAIVLGLSISCVITYLYAINFKGFIEFQGGRVSDFKEADKGLHIFTKYVFFICLIISTGATYLISNRFVKNNK